MKQTFEVTMTVRIDSNKMLGRVGPTASSAHLTEKELKWAIRAKLEFIRGFETVIPKISVKEIN